uniref:Uncharacterized protein n=1 Tax=Timema douglasi TaxID=61478 RepID=A0A7R8ZGG4_TIMDO|nr:unnamed protein product [Timema douglasi]
MKVKKSCPLEGSVKKADYSSPMASLVLTDSSQLTSGSQHLGIYSSPVASLVLTDNSQLTSDSQHLGIYSSPVASLVLTDCSQLTSDSQHLVYCESSALDYAALEASKVDVGCILNHESEEKPQRMPYTGYPFPVSDFSTALSVTDTRNKVAPDLLQRCL